MPVRTVFQKFIRPLWGKIFQRIVVLTNIDYRFRIFILTNSLNSATFAWWKIRFMTEVCNCSLFFTDAMLWIKEVEMVESVDDLMSSSSIRGIQMPNFEVLDAWIASALNRIIQNSRFKKKRSVWRTEEDRLLTWSTSTSGSLEPMLPSRIMQTYLRCCSSKWWYSGNRFESGTEFDCLMTKIPHDDILEGLYKLGIRESEKVKTVLELYDVEIHKKKVRI